MTDQRPATPATPSADEVKAIMRSQNIKVALLALVLIALGAGSIWITADSRNASENSRDAVLAQLAQNDRSACITDRRTAELDAKGRMIAALGRAQLAGFFDDDDAEVQRQAALFEKWAAIRDQAAASMAPDVLNLPRPEGCGVPVTTANGIADSPSPTTTEAP